MIIPGLADFFSVDVILQSEVKIPAPLNKTKSILVFLHGLSAAAGVNRCMQQLSQGLEGYCYSLLMDMETKVVFGYADCSQR